ncbi:Pre-mRNA-splicing factor [Mortierella polycephala]|uniref:Pre-mRNA-splicing factor n=1 Tax=Mortierella polycephala TaxID=41804 RepID=A0A9P6TUE2_9FUNG|nr:Pre-mRNA-splicing factor [Mortierella polycephala]
MALHTTLFAHVNPRAFTSIYYQYGTTREDCGWLHRIPTRQDHVDSGVDVFGRERFDEHRDDRGGVGSIRSDSKTLYVGRIHQAPDMEATVEKHFKAWGDLERIKVLQDKGIAFVTYQSRLNAEFAKEAMANQSLDHGEIVNIRWATEDPNPGIQARNKRKAVETVRLAVESRLPEDFKRAEHLPGPEEAIGQGPDKRQKQAAAAVATNDSSNGVSDPTPTLYLGADGQYYYDYGEYGYNHETQQYDPTRLSHYQGTASDSSTTPSLQDRVKASLLSSSASTTALAVTPSASAVKDTTIAKSKPAASALSALAAYGSDSDSEDDGQ